MREKSRLYPILWKELRDMSRDVRTLAAISLMPLIMMPLMGLSSIYVQQLQPGVVVLLDQDSSTGTIGNATLVSSSDLMNKLREAFERSGYFVLTEPSETFDLEIILPAGFITNLTSFNKTALVKIVRNVASTKAQQAESIALNVISSYSWAVAEAKITYLGELASIPVEPVSVMNPVVTTTMLVAPSGEVVSHEENIRVILARILAFSLVFVTTPSIAYITDSVVGEKERKTFEALLATPVPRWSLVIGKALSASMIGLVTGISDAVGLLLFFAIPSLTYGYNLLTLITPELILAHATAVYISVLASLALILPVVIRSGSYRVAQAFSLIIIGAASIVFFISLYADIGSMVPAAKYGLYIIPYTHAVEMIKVIVIGEVQRSVTHALIAIAEIGALLGLAIKLFSEEKIIYSKT